MINNIFSVPIFFMGFGAGMMTSGLIMMAIESLKEYKKVHRRFDNAGKKQEEKDID